jgi:hypothetical protein
MTMPMRRRSRAGSELAKEEARSFLPQHERTGAGESMTGWKGLWKSQQWAIISFAVAFGLLVLYILAVSLVCRFDLRCRTFADRMLASYII